MKIRNGILAMVCTKKFFIVGFMPVVLAMCLLLTGCGSESSGDDSGGVSGGDGSASSSEGSGYDLSYTDRELDASYDEDAAVKITLKDGDISIAGDETAAVGNAAAEDNIVTISSEGTYILSGSLSDGQVVVETPDSEKVQLVLDGVDISCSDNAPVLIRESDKVFLTLAEGSDNSLKGPADYSELVAEAGVDGVIYSKADLCINGSGALTVSAASEHGIVSKDDLVITGGHIDITAAEDGLQGKDCVKIKDGTFVIDSDHDGIKSSNAEDDGRGFVSIDGGNFTLDAGYDGIQAETLLRIAGGDFDITTGGGSQYASTQDNWGESWGGGRNQQTPGDMMMPGGPGGPNGGSNKPSSNPNSDSDGGQSFDGESEDQRSMQNGDGTTPSDNSENFDSTDTVSAKGLKGDQEVLVLGGDLFIDSSDDSIHSNGDVTINKGVIALTSGDDGIHADSDLLIDGGTLDISQSYEGIEGNTITVDGGSIDITASDDGLNAAGGADGSSVDGRAGQDPFAVDESAFIEINGGDVAISASGDGIDSNGTLDITDGFITVSCPTVGDTAVLDYAADGSITGGTFIGTGAVQMAQTFSSSVQGVVAVSVGEQTADSTVVLMDADGKEILSHEVPQAFAVVILSSPNVISGNTYTLKAGDVSGEVTAN